jgi:hypothetical protein
MTFGAMIRGRRGVLDLAASQPSMEEAPEMSAKDRGRRKTRDLHFLNEDGKVACNPRDREAAHRAEVEDIATGNPRAVTCKNCWAVMRQTGVLRPSRKKVRE